MPISLLSPGIRLFDRFTFRIKFALVAGAILLPLLYLLWLVLADMAESKTTAELEHRSAVALRAYVPAILAAQRQRGHVNALLNGDAAARERIGRAAGEAEAALRAVAGTLAELPAGSRLADDLEELRRRLAALPARAVEELDAEASFKAHSVLIGDMIGYAHTLADAGKLTLDPEMGTYYLQDAIQGDLLELMEETAKLRGLTAGLLAGRTALPGEAVASAAKAELRPRMEQVENRLKSLQAALAKVFDASGEMRAQLEAELTGVREGTRQLLAVTADETLNGRQEKTAEGYFAFASGVLEQQAALATTSLAVLESSLAARGQDIAARQGLILASVALLLLAAAYFLAVISVSVARGVQRIDAAARAMAGGDFTLRIEAAGRDEIGRIAKSFNHVTAAMSGLILQVRSAADTLAGEADALTGQARSIAEAAERQSDATGTSAAAIEEVTVSIAHVADESRHTAGLAEESSRIAEEGAAVVAETGREMATITEAVRGSAGQIERLHERATEIGGIVGVIKDIADQTNLLALNAAIEAARAGDLGRGFAVVADEVRKLAERTGQATAEITTMIQAIQAESGSAVAAMHEHAGQVDRGVGLSERTTTALHDIRSSFASVLERVDNIGQATLEQKHASAELARSVENIAQMAERNVFDAASVSEVAGQISRLAEDMRQRLAGFRLADAPRPAAGAAVPAPGAAARPAARAAAADDYVDWSDLATEMRS